MLLFSRRGNIYSLLLVAFFLQGYKSMGTPVFSDSIPASQLSINIETLPAAANDSISAIIPFSRAGNLILVKAKADTIEGNFILDTGSPYLVLNLPYFRDYPSELSTDEEQSGMNGAAGEVLQTIVRQFSFGGI